MTDQPIVPNEVPSIRPCFAYNQSKQRCDMPGGHPGLHSITETWGDDECYDPTAEITVSLVEYGTVRSSHGETEHLVDVPVELPNCEVCSHKAEYHPMQGACIMGQCDCKNYVG